VLVGPVVGDVLDRNCGGGLDSAIGGDIGEFGFVGDLAVSILDGVALPARGEPIPRR
jgi:hypothetical protein